MADARLEVSIGKTSFVGEGTEEWLSGEFEKLLSYLSSSRSIEDEEAGSSDLEEAPTQQVAGNPEITAALGKYLQDKNATTNQVRKFLATALWLHDRGGVKEIATADVTKALRDNHQSRIQNAAKELGRNIAKGYCERTANGFFVTPEGKVSLSS
jgi:hypothetical protein